MYDALCIMKLHSLAHCISLFLAATVLSCLPSNSFGDSSPQETTGNKKPVIPAILIYPVKQPDGTDSYQARWVDENLISASAIKTPPDAVNFLPLLRSQVDPVLAAGNKTPENLLPTIPAPHIDYGKGKTINVYYPWQQIQITVNNQPQNYGGTKPSLGAAGKEADPNIYYKTYQDNIFTKADDLEIDISYAVLSADTTKTPQSIALQPILLPVDYDLFHGFNVSYSSGLWYSTLQNDSVQLVSAGSGNSTITQGVSNKNYLKEAVLTHLSIWKHGDVLFGPFMGVASNLGSPSTSTSALFGFSLAFGKESRFALNLGAEMGSVNRLSGYQYGATVPSSATVTQSVTRWSGIEFGLTYYFGGGSTSSGNGTQNQSQGQNKSQTPNGKPKPGG